MALENPTAIAGSLRRVWRNAGAPTDGTSGTKVGSADPGDLLIDTTNTGLYQNTNTKASPTWAQVLVEGVTFTGDLDINGDITLSGDIALDTEDVSVAQGKFVYLDGQAGGEYIVSDTANELMINATTEINVAIGGTDEITITATVFSPATSGGMALGSGTLMWADLFLESGGVINFNNGDVTITHSANALAFAGVTGGYTFDDTVGSSDTTAGFEVTGAATDGFKVTGACTDAIDIGACTNAINITGTVTKVLSAGSYSSMLTSQNSELITVAATDTTGWILGIGSYMRATGEDGYPFGICTLVESTHTTGTDRMQGIQAMAFLGTPGGTQAAHLKTLGGDATAGMYGAWFKVGANSNCVCDSGSRVAAIWADNQMSGTISGEEYAIFITTGASKPDAVFGLETTSSGWSQLFYLDETMAAAEPFVSTGCSVTVATVPYLKVLVNATQYGIPLIAI